MSIRSFYLKRYFDKRQSKISLIFLVVFSLIYVTYFAIATKDAWFFKIIFLLLGLYELVGVLYLLKNGLYLKKGEKYEKPKSVPPEEFLAKVKKEVLNGK